MASGRVMNAIKRIGPPQRGHTRVTDNRTEHRTSRMLLLGGSHFPIIPLDHKGPQDDTRGMKQSVLAKNVDSKGRLTLGEVFANRTVLVEDRGSGEVLVRLARVIPEREAWLYKNPTALTAVRRGLKQAAGGKLSGKGPNLKSAAALAAQLNDD